MRPAANIVGKVEAKEPSTVRPADVVRARHRFRGGSRVIAAPLVLAGVAVLIAGCGGGSSIGVASISGSGGHGRHSTASRHPSGGEPVGFFGVAETPAQRAGAQVASLLFSRCMRSHGVPDFPDPTAGSGGGIEFGGGASGLDPAAPLFRLAQQRCISILIRRRRAELG
jgi:hypothetical protein